MTKLKWKAVNSMSGMAMLAMVFFLTEEDLKNSPKINDKNTQLGDIKYKDISGPDGVPDGKIFS